MIMKVIFFDKIRFAVLFIGLLTVFSCAKENEPLPEEYKKNKLVNDWIQENMEVVYFWNTKIPTKQDKTLYPADYYESILYRQEDHFSFIAEDYAKLRDELNGVVLEAGYHFSLFRKDAVAPDIFGMIDYVKPNSPASSTDLKRGDYFLTINGKQINIDNYKKLV